MERYELIAPCHFGLEAVLKKEITDLGYEITEVENGRVSFEGDACLLYTSGRREKKRYWDFPKNENGFCALPAACFLWEPYSALRME